MKIKVYKNKELAEKVSSLLEKQIKKNPKTFLGLATGKTMIPIYKNFIKKAKKGSLDLSKITTINLDEYSGIKNNDRRSLRSYMKKNFFEPLMINEKRTTFPKGNKEKLSILEKKLMKRRVDIQLLGIGRNGHIAFDEPGSEYTSKTRKVKLTKKTQEDNKVRISEAYTLGISTIMKTKKIFLVATGRKKAEIIKKMINEPISSAIPATYLRRKKNVTVFLDKEAASKLYNNP